VALVVFTELNLVDKVALTVVMVVVVVMVVLDHLDRHLSVVVAEHHLAVVPVVPVMKDQAEAVAHCKAVLTRNQTLVDLVPVLVVEDTMEAVAEVPVLTPKTNGPLVVEAAEVPLSELMEQISLQRQVEVV
jgi:hypothetical protein|tara:strand:- start:110 stop:502 length:393 start_codon:yes stop_codon:yes gene_type:complete